MLGKGWISAAQCQDSQRDKARLVDGWEMDGTGSPSDPRRRWAESRPSLAVREVGEELREVIEAQVSWSLQFKVGSMSSVTNTLV